MIIIYARTYDMFMYLSCRLRHAVLDSPKAIRGL